MKIGIVEKFVATLHDKTEFVIQIRNLKQALNHAFILKKVLKVLKFNQNPWLKPYIDMNTFEEDFLRWWIMQLLEKNYGNLLAIEIKKMQILINKPVYLGL